MLTLDLLTPQQLDASLAEASTDVNPADVKAATLLEQLGRHRRVLQKYRGKGYSADQIAGFLRQPKIGITVSPSLIRKVLRTPAAGTKTSAGRAPRQPVKYQAIVPAAVSTAPAGGTTNVAK